jgi:PAS domain S-box-containing protein
MLTTLAAELFEEVLFLNESVENIHYNFSHNITADMYMTPLKSIGFEMFDLFELTPDLVCIAGKNGYFRKVNAAVIDKLGYTEEELFSKPISSFIHPDDKDLTQQERAELLEGKALLNFQNRYVAKNGQVFWFAWTSIYLPDKEVVFAIAKDITERKLIEKEIEEKYIKFKGLATHFKSSLETNRKYLALELHEELAQLAAVIKMDMDWISSHEQGLSAFSAERLLHASKVAELLINTIRKISFSISPGMLDDLGLNAVLEWQCNEFSMLNGIHCEFKSDYDEGQLTREIEFDFFRICQESLTNIIDHAAASNVQISIEDKGGHILLSITDDGKGFEIKKQKKVPGLINIQKRVASVNGHLMIESEPWKGTSVRVTVAKPQNNR